MKSSVTNRKQRFWAVLLAVVMVVGLLPTADVKAEILNVDDNPSVASPSLVGKVLNGNDGNKDTINNTNASGGNAIEICYLDTDNSILYTETVLAGNSHSVKTYTECIPVGTVPKVQAANVSNKWEVKSVTDYSAASATAGATLAKIELCPLIAYVIKYNSAGGTDPANGSFVAGDTIDVTTVSPGKRAGYEFDGWYDSVKIATKTTVVDDSFCKNFGVINGDGVYEIALTAVWNITNKSYNVTYKNNIPADENTSEAVPTHAPDVLPYWNAAVATALIPGSVNLPAAPTNQYKDPVHYTFTGWQVDTAPAGTTPIPTHGTGDNVGRDTLLSELGQTSNWATVTEIPMTATWKANTYCINYNLDTGIPAPAPGTVTVPAKTAQKAYGTELFDVEAMEDTTSTYGFKGWTFDAKLSDPTDTTKIHLNSGTISVKEAVDAYEKYLKTTLPDTGSIELYGVWMPLQKVIYKGNGDDNNTSILVLVDRGDTIPLRKNTSDEKITIAKNGYHLTGWNTQSDGKGDHLDLGENVLILADKTFYAEWKQNTYTVAFDANTTDTVTGTMTPQGFAYGDPAVALSKNQFARTGYTFTGWATTPTGAVTYTDGQEVKDLTNVDNTTVTLYAVWQKNTYTITWNDGDGNVLGTTTVAYGDVPAYTLAATPTKSSDATYTYTFSGWNDGAASYAVGTALPALVADTTYTAYYSASVRNYTITWKDGDGNTLGTTTVAYGTVPTYTINKTPTKSADATYTYSFNNTWSPAIVAVTGDAIYTAQFAGTAKPTGTSPAPTGTSPTPAIVTPTATPTPAVVTPTATPTPDPNGDGGNGGQGTPVEEKIYDIKYFEVDDDGNEIELKNTGNPKTYKYGEGAVIDKKLDREGYVFLGWFTKDGTKPVTKISKKAKGTKKLYARYEAVPEDDGTGDGNDNINGNPSDFSTLFVRLTNYTEDSMTLTWEAMEYIDGYDIFGSRCNSKDVIRPYEPIASVGADKTEYVMSDLLAKTYYKFYIRAYILVNNEKRYITTSINVHGVTLNDTYGVADEINIDKVVTKSGKKSRTKYNRAKDGDVEEINITMKVGQTLTIVTSEYNADGKEIRAHRPISFESSNPNICKVGKKNSHKYGVAVAGKANTYKSRTITAKAAGECTIWVFAQNGIYTKVNVKVKPAD